MFGNGTLLVTALVLVIVMASIITLTIYVVKRIRD